MNENYDCFEEMNLKNKLLRGIISYGYEKPSPIQSKGIIPVINGNDCIIQSQSGTGKTATFTISSLEIIDESIESCQIIILNPTREIADQTLNVIKNIGNYLNYNIVGVIGGKKNDDNLNKAQILVATPGRIYDVINRGYINMRTLKLVILDEVDQILNKGFKEQIINIFEYIPLNTQISIYSATIPNDILELTNKFMRNPLRILLKKENLTLEGIKQYYVLFDNEKDKFESLLELFNTFSMGQTIIYCISKKKVIWLNDQLMENGYPISQIHGDLSQLDRDIIMKKFRKNETRILITTDLLSRGIDVQQVEIIINYDIPKSIATYIHRIGRSGRFGRKGVAINFITEKEFGQLEKIQNYYHTAILPVPENIKEIV